jgi:peptidoglycan/LPS O-acetylase OafA/YrhL
MTWLADVSYGTYLGHFVIMTYLLLTLSPPQTGSAGDLVLWFAVTLVIATAYGYLSARFLERPIRRWAHRYGRTATARAPDDGGAVPVPSAGRNP